MARYKCPHCNQFLNSDEEYISYKNRRWHKNCYEVMVKQKAKEELEYRQLMGYIKQIFGDKANYIVIGKQIKEYVEKYQLTYGEIQYCLYYFYEIRKNPVTTGSIGIIPYIFKEAFDYKKRQEQIALILQNQEDTKIIKEERVVKITPPQRQELTHLKPINLDDII